MTTRETPTHAGFTIAALLAVLGAGCATGPKTIPRDRFGYGAAVGDSWKREALLNIVKLRYADPPVFLEVSQIINQYELKGQVDVRADFTGTDKQSVGGLGSYIDRPTITYRPLGGSNYARSMLTPVEPLSLVYLVRSGWNVDLLFRTCVSSVNGLSNSSNQVPRPPTLPQFNEMLEVLERVRAAGGVGMRVGKQSAGAAGKDPGGPVALMFFRKPGAGAATEDLLRLKELLGLDPEASEFELTFGNVAEHERQVALLTRSLLEIMLQFAGEVDVPPEHASEGRVFEGRPEELDKLLHVHSGSRAPPEAFVQVRYRDHFFWIDDRDFSSKRYFLFLNVLTSLVETGVKGGGAVLTVSAGG